MYSIQKPWKKFKLIILRSAGMTGFFLSVSFLLIGLTMTMKKARADTKPKSFTIYCTSNKDDTGTCVREDNNETVLCILIPGQTTACTSERKERFNCVSIGNYQFSCKPGTKSGIIETNPGIEFQSPFGKGIDRGLGDPFKQEYPKAF